MMMIATIRIWNGFCRTETEMKWNFLSVLSVAVFVARTNNKLKVILCSRCALGVEEMELSPRKQNLDTDHCDHWPLERVWLDGGCLWRAFPRHWRRRDLNTRSRSGLDTSMTNDDVENIEDLYMVIQSKINNWIEFVCKMRFMIFQVCLPRLN